MIHRIFIALAAISVSFASAQEKPAAPAKPTPSEPAPTHADVSFGPHPHQLIDIYLLKTGNVPYLALHTA